MLSKGESFREEDAGVSRLYDVLRAVFYELLRVVFYDVLRVRYNFKI